MRPTELQLPERGSACEQWIRRKLVLPHVGAPSSSRYLRRLWRSPLQSRLHCPAGAPGICRLERTLPKRRARATERCGSWVGLRLDTIDQCRNDALERRKKYIGGSIQQAGCDRVRALYLKRYTPGFCQLSRNMPPTSGGRLRVTSRMRGQAIHTGLILLQLKYARLAPGWRAVDHAM